MRLCVLLRSAKLTTTRQQYAARFEEQRQLHLPQNHKATVPDSTLNVEMTALEEQADNPRPLLQAPRMARDHPSNECQRRF